MLNILKQSRKLINGKDNVCIVIGNESCDLDSAVSTLAIAYIGQMTNFKQIVPSVNTNKFLPVLNITREDYPLKTEVINMLQPLSITNELLTFRDELSSEFCRAAQFILVDHHSSPWISQCIAVYDHRPRDTSIVFPDNCIVHIESVGSCSTLIAEELINANLFEAKDQNIIQLLRNTIILDTVNFSETAQRATSKDKMICEILEDKLKLYDKNLLSRKSVFDALVKARSDISHLTTMQLLKKDMKIVSSPQTKVTISIPGLPITVKNLLKQPKLEENIIELARFTNSSIIVLMGMEVIPTNNAEQIQRDIGLINIKDCRLYDKVKQALLSLREPDLKLEVYNNCNFMGGCFYKQLNHKATRKHVLPIIQQILMMTQ